LIAAAANLDSLLRSVIFQIALGVLTWNLSFRLHAVMLPQPDVIRKLAEYAKDYSDSTQGHVDGERQSWV